MVPYREWRSVCRRHGSLLLALLCALIAALPLLGPGIVNTRAGGDSPFLLQRLHQMVAALRAGQFPVRWMPDAAYGMGYPFFNFYAALPYYVAALFSFLGGGYTAALKLTQVLGTLAASAVMYGFVRRATRDESAAVLSAIAYTYAPFHLVNVYVRGDSLSEYWAFVFYPVIFWALLNLRDRPSVRSMVLLGLGYGCLVVTHNVSAMVFTPFIALYCLALVATLKSGRSRFVSLALAAGVLGLLLSAWFWVPALLERPGVQLEEMATGYFHYSEHFRWANLVQWEPIFNYAVDRQTTPFSMGLAQVLLAGAGIAVSSYRWRKTRRLEPQIVSGFAVLLVATWMVTPLSSVVWENVPLLAMAQFPWRFLSVQALGVAWVGGSLASGLSRRRWMVWALGALLVVSSAARLRPERLHVMDAEVTADRLMLYEAFTGNIGSTVRHEYLPSSVVPRPYTSVYHLSGELSPRLRVLRGQVDGVALASSGPTGQQWRVQVTSSEADVAMELHYYAGWRAWVDGSPVEARAADGTGWIAVTVPEGEHELRVWLGRTPIRAAVEILSLLAVGVSLVLLRPLGSKRAVVRGMLGAVSLLLVVTAAFQVGRALPATYDTDDDMTMDFARAPYLHHNPDGVRFADGARLISYGLSGDELVAGESFDVELQWDGWADVSRWARVELVSMTQHLFGVDYPYSESTEAILGAETTHRVTVPTDAPRGAYLIAVKPLGEEGEIRPVTKAGQTLGTTYLRPVRVVSASETRPESEPLGEFGSGIALTGVRSDQLVQGQLRVQLTWQCREPINQNYALSLRLHDAEGRVVASRDLPPFCGAFPTSAWQPGDRIADRQVLTLPEGTAPGHSYSLEAILYHLPSLAPLGSATVPGISVTMPSVRRVERVTHQYRAELALKKITVSATEVRGGEEVRVNVLWAATEAPSRRYGCRLALLDSQGSVVTLSGELSISPEFPTSVWPRDALVAERYRLPTYMDTPPGTYRVAVELLGADSEESLGVYLSPLEISVGG
jgi:hypothetical protein